MYYKKRDHINDVSEDTEEDEVPETDTRQSCDNCGKGKYNEFEIMDKVFGTCDVCEDRKKLK